MAKFGLNRTKTAAREWRTETLFAFRPFDCENLDMTLHVGLCGAGIGGLAAAIAIAQGGARVTVLEAAEELGEARTPSQNLL